jgi:hypothetical protein
MKRDLENLYERIGKINSALINIPLKLTSSALKNLQEEDTVKGLLTYYY